MIAAVQVPMLFESRQAEISLLTGVSDAFNPKPPHGLGFLGPN